VLDLTRICYKLSLQLQMVTKSNATAGSACESKPTILLKMVASIIASSTALIRPASLECREMIYRCMANAAIRAYSGKHQIAEMKCAGEQQIMVSSATEIC
jgi:hypothetical protein